VEYTLKNCPIFRDQLNRAPEQPYGAIYVVIFL